MMIKKHFFYLKYNEKNNIFRRSLSLMSSLLGFLFFTTTFILPAELHYGDMITLQHKASKELLNCSNNGYYHFGEDFKNRKYQYKTGKDVYNDAFKLSTLKAVTMGGNEREKYWFIVMPTNSADYGKKVSSLATVRLQHVITRSSLAAIDKFLLDFGKNKIWYFEPPSPSGATEQKLVAGINLKNDLPGSFSFVWSLVSSDDTLTIGSTVQIQSTVQTGQARYLAAQGTAERSFGVAVDEFEVYTTIKNSPEETQWQIADHFAWTQIEDDFYANNGTSMAIVAYQADGSHKLLEIKDIKLGRGANAYHLMQADSEQQTPGRSFSLIQNGEDPFIAIKSARAGKVFLLAREKEKKDSGKVVFDKNEVYFHSDKIGDYERFEVIPTMHGTFKLRSKANDNYLALYEQWDGDALLWTETRDPVSGNRKNSNFNDGLEFTFNAFGTLKLFDANALTYSPMEALIPLAPATKELPFEKTVMPEEGGLLVTCKIKAPHAALIRLQSETGRYYDLCLGINRDTQSVIKKGFSGATAPILRSWKTKDLFNKEEERSFWIHYQLINNMGYIAVGQGEWDGSLKNCLLVFVDDAPITRIRKIGFGSCGTRVQFSAITFSKQTVKSDFYESQGLALLALTSGTMLAADKIVTASLPAGSGAGGSFTKQDKDKIVADLKVAQQNRDQLVKQYSEAVTKAEKALNDVVQARLQADKDKKQESLDNVTKLQISATSLIDAARQIKKSLDEAREKYSDSEALYKTVMKK